MNTPSTTNLKFDSTKALPVMESFYTIQGEGFHQGKAAYFIRLAGCDVGCTWCDVKDSWDAEEHEIVPISQLKKSLQFSKAEIVVITGGEPAMYNLEGLTTMVKNLGLKTHIETSGAYPITGTWDWICVSPKRFKKALQECLIQAHELKVIIFRFAQNYSKLVNAECKLYLQPEWNVAEDMMPEIISFVKESPQYRISLQVHKYLNIP
jgi:7-carboxy-7-deazaguanine synthase